MFWFDQAGFKQWQEPQLNRRWITAGYRYEMCLTNAFTMHFGQPVNGLFKQLRRSVRLAIPLFPDLGVTQAEIGREIDHAGALREQFSGQGMSDAVWCGEEHRIALAETLRVGLAEGEFGIVITQVGIHVTDTHTSLGARSNGSDFDFGVLGQQPE